MALIKNNISMKLIYDRLFFSKNKRKVIKKLGFALTMLLAGVNNIHAQVSSYTFAQSSGTFTPLTGGTVLGTATSASGSGSLYNIPTYPVTLPFAFNFNGFSYNNIQVTSNGYITFGGTDTDLSSTPISDTSNWNGVVSAFGRSLQAAYHTASSVAGDIRWDVVGTAPNREMVIQWTNFKPSYSSSTTNIYAFSFQIRLKEGINQIVTTYNSGSYLTGNSAITGTAQIGLRGASNADYNNRLNSTSLAFSSSTPGTASNSTQAFSTSSTSAQGMPPAGLTYTWTPQTCFAPILTTFSTTTNSATVNWNAPTPAPTSYDVYYSTTNTAPTNTTTPSLTNITGTTATLNSLSPATMYYIWVRSNCATGNGNEWSTIPVTVLTLCQPPALLSANGATVCPGIAATLNATSDTGSIITWYDSATAGSQLATGNSYTTPALTSTTNYWVSTKQTQNGVGGKATPVSTSGNTGVGIGLVIDAFKDMVINSVDVYPYTTTASNAGPGTITINLVNAAGTVLQTNVYNVNVTYNQAAAAVAPPNTIQLNYNIPAGLGYKLLVFAKSSSVSGLIRESDAANFSFPYVIGGICQLNSTTSGYYYYFYNLNVTGVCESQRQQVTATVDAACLGTNEVSTKDNFKVSPNPVVDYINISNFEKVKSATVVDFSGRIIKKIDNISEKINLVDLHSGIFLLNLELKDGSRTSHKIIKK